MAFRTTLASISAIVLPLLCLLLAPGAADAGKVKSPFWASVAADGTLLRSTPGIAIFAHSTGTTQMIFPLDTEACVATATTSEGWVGGIGVNQDGAVIIVSTTNPASGALLSLPFNLVVHCPK